MPIQVVMSDTGSSAELKLTEATRLALEPNQVRIRTRASAINYLDLMIRQGELPESAMPTLPHVLGVEGSGVVTETGSSVTQLKSGDRVIWMGHIGTGGYAEEVCVDSRYICPVPDSVDLIQAGAIPVNATTAWHMLVNLAQVKVGQTVLIHGGSGGVGSLAIQLAKHLGLTVITTASAKKLDFCRTLGAELALDYRSDDLVNEILSFTDGIGVQVSLNSVAGESLVSDMSVLADHGTVIIYGFLGGPPTQNLSELLVPYFNKSVGIRVSDIYTYYNSQPEAFRADLQHLIGLLAEGTIATQIHEKFPLSEAARAHELMELGSVKGKLMLVSEEA